MGGVCRLLTSFFVAKLLGPQSFGTWRFINIFSDYVHFTSLGTQPAMQREVPFLRGKSDFKSIEVVLRTVCATTFFSSITYSFALVVISYFLKDASYAAALIAFAPVILLLSWLRYAQEFSLATQMYGLRVRLEFLQAVSSILGVGLIILWDIYGAIVGLGLSALIPLITAARKLSEHFSMRIELVVLQNLFATGFPLIADIILLITFSNADRILIAAMLSPEELGVYSIGYAAVGILGVVASAFGQMLFVKFAEIDGETKSNDYIAEVLEKTTIVLSCVFASMLSVALAFFPIVVVSLLPQYVEGIEAGKLLIAAIFFLGVSLPVTKWCVSTGRSLPVLTVRFAVVCGEFIAVYLVILKGLRLEFVAFCVLCAFAIFHCAIGIIGNYLLKKPLRVGIITLGHNTMPFLIIVAGIWISYFVYPTGPYIPGSRLIISCMTGLVVSMALSIPFVYWINKRTQLVTLLVKRFKLSLAN
jgi:O-antigen/teichoic acid export membrane protein